MRIDAAFRRLTYSSNLFHRLDGLPGSGARLLTKDCNATD